MGFPSPFRDGNGKKTNELCSRYAGRERELPKSFPAIWDGNGNYQKLSRYLGRERETKKSFLAVWEREFKGFPLGNIREREFLLMPGAWLTIYFFGFLRLCEL